MQHASNHWDKDRLALHRKDIMSECCVCLNQIDREIDAVSSFPCGHHLHLSCAVSLLCLQKKSICPICRGEMQTREGTDLVEEIEGLLAQDKIEDTSTVHGTPSIIVNRHTRLALTERGPCFGVVQASVTQDREGQLWERIGDGLIRSVSSRRFLGLRAREADYGVELMTQNIPSSQFQYTEDGRLMHVYSNMTVEIGAGYTAEDAPAQLWPPDQDPWQRWNMVNPDSDADSGENVTLNNIGDITTVHGAPLLIINKHTRLVLTERESCEVVQASLNSNRDFQLWEKVGGHLIRSVSTGRFLGLAGEATYGIELQTQTVPNSQFKLLENEQLMHVASNMVVGIRGGDRTENSPAQLWSLGEDPCHAWSLIDPQLVEEVLISKVSMTSPNRILSYFWPSASRI
uniref:RING-type domain-containing protein n=1 Tax=Corethron hystrix TaxID=216773 RepID=A0A7S1BSV6_9STRA|mmetsp:Transcript_37501/g.87448  ORF Transcript_37501/g.87448 Transcript_37501/m.87448 type:complete len:402 (+) Transcript_37501:71-1276(+)